MTRPAHRRLRLANWFWHASQLALTEPYMAAFHRDAADVFARRAGEHGRESLTIGYPAYHVSERTVPATDAWLADDQRPRLVAEGRDDVSGPSAPAPSRLDPDLSGWYR